MGKIIKRNIAYIGKILAKLIGSLATVLTIIFVFFTWEDFEVLNLKTKIGCLALILIILAFISVIYVCAGKKQKVIWQNSSGKIIVRYGDLLEESFRNNTKETKLYVIPVNSAFDTIVDKDISLCDKPLVSPNTVHGKWIAKMNESGKDTAYIDTAIQNCLKKQNKLPKNVLEESQKKQGKREVYALGTVAAVKCTNQSIFLLLALTDFDENNNAHVSTEDLETVVKSLIDFYDRHGQGYELVLPLMGTNLSRAGLSHEESLKVITTKFLLYKDKIHGSVNIVIHKADKDKITIFSS